MYKGEADWSYLNLSQRLSPSYIPVCGQWDIDSPEKALEYKIKYDAME